MTIHVSWLTIHWIFPNSHSKLFCRVVCFEPFIQVNEKVKYTKISSKNNIVSLFLPWHRELTQSLLGTSTTRTKFQHPKPTEISYTFIWPNRHTQNLINSISGHRGTSMKLFKLKPHLRQYRKTRTPWNKKGERYSWILSPAKKQEFKQD